MPYYHEESERKELLRICDALKNNKTEIAAFFVEHSDNKERGDFIKSFFDNIYVEKILSNGQRAGYRAWDDVLTLWRGAYLSREKEVFIQWESVANVIYAMILLDEWLDPDERPLPSEAEQISFTEQAEAEKASAFTLSQEAIDYILCCGSGVFQGKYRIYEQFQKKEGKQKNIKFLRDEYGVGGHSDAIPGSGYWEHHNRKGITISRDHSTPDGEILLTWAKVEKRIGELIAAGRYLNRAEKERYPAYQRQSDDRPARRAVSEEFWSIIQDYDNYQTQLSQKDKCLDGYPLALCRSAFASGQKKIYQTKEGQYILPLMREAMQTIIGEGTDLTERCEIVLAELSGPLAAPLEPTYDELNPPITEYHLALGDTVYLGAQEYELLAFDDQTVRLFDPTFPLINKELSRTEFDRLLTENSLNHGLLQEVEDAAPAAEPVEPDALQAVGRIEFLGTNGMVGDSVEYTSAEQFVAAVKDENFVGTPMRIIVYRDKEGQTIPLNFVKDLDPRPLGFRVVEYAERYQRDSPGYELGFGYMGNGMVVWNRLELRHGDYKTIAHISPDRTVKFYEDGLPEDVRAHIETIAATSTMSISATQDAPVFSTPPLVRGPAVPSTEASEPAYLPHELPYIFCEWSESIVFQDKTAYTLQEFDRLMEQADDEYVAGKTAAMAKYGTWQKWYDANDPEYKNFLGYDKVKFTLVMPNGQIFTERQDIGDGDGGVLDFLEQYDKYRKIVPALREAIRKEAEGPLNISAPQPEPVSGRFWDAYNSVKERYHDSLVLYQVGDFFELYGEDAKTAALELDLTLTLRNIPEYGRVPMCGFPAHALEDNAARLTVQGHDVTVAALEETQRKISLLPAPPVEKAKRIIRHFYTDDFEKPVDFSDLHNVTFSHRTTRDGKHHIAVTADLINYRLICQADGEVMLSLQCHDMDDLTEYLTNLSVDNLIDYVEAQYKKRQPQQKDDDLSDIDPAAIRAALAENGIVDGHVVDPEKLDANPFIQQVIADVEQIAADALTPDERFSIIETDNGHAIWDEVQNGIYVDGEGVQEEFSSEWQAEDYLKQVRKHAADKEAADWLAVERAKQGTQEPAEKESDTAPAEPNSYRLLSRLRSDCEYYLGAGQFSEKHLWAGSVKAQISKMRELYAALPEKPEWLTEQDIDRYEARMNRIPAERENAAGTVEKGAESLADGHGHDSAGPAQALTAEKPRDPLAPAYKVGDTVYLENTAFLIDEIRDSEVSLRDPALIYPIFRSESRENFERLLQRDEKNLFITDYFPISKIGPADNGDDLREVLTVQGGLLERVGISEVSSWLRDGLGNTEIARLLAEKYDRTDESITLETGETVNYSLYNERFSIDLRNKSHTVVMYDLRTVAGVLRSMYQREMGGFTHKPIQAAPETEILTDGPAQAPPAPRRRPKVSPFLLHPEVPNADRHEYHITDDAIGAGTPGTRFNNNVRAIRLLKKLEREERFATPEEQAVLAQYVGWGGLSDCFDERHSKYAELKALLTEDEYEAAAESTLTAFYTPPVVIRSIYQALENMGFKAGNLLEPSCGIGNFIGMRPESLTGSKIYGIELDGISGRIAQQLYQKSSIAVQGFEKTDLPDSFFDAAIGNVPFGPFKVPDKRYDKHNFLIHDYFFARTLDKVRPGGIIAFVTSKGTMDKENPSVRKYIAQRADLLGAIRLPNNTFKDAAGTEVTSDILFFQKRDALSCEEPDWVHLNTDENGLKMNQYFIDHPDMVMGEMKEISGPYGPEPACLPHEGQDLGEQLNAAIQNIQGSITEYVMDDPEAEEEDRSIPADPEVRNFSYTVVDGQVYYRENSRMNPVEVSVTAANRIKGLIEIRDCVRTLIEYQTDEWPGEDIKAEQRKLNTLYDAFVKKYGRINSRANSTAFRMDSAYFLLSSLEVLDDDRNFVRKADMFTKRTIKQKAVITSVDTASEALAVSMAEKVCVDLGYMASLMGGGDKIPQVVEDLRGVIFKDPLTGSFDIDGDAVDWYKGWQTADEYLSGNVREKLAAAKLAAKSDPAFQINVEALEKVQPVDLTASEISVRLGSTWLPMDVVERFVFDLLDTSANCRGKIHAHFSQYAGTWNIEGKSVDRVNVKANSTYGTTRITAYKIIEETLNLRDVRIFDYVQDRDGKKIAILNKKETAIAQGKQGLIKQAFQDWIWKDPERRERLTKLYNEKFNNVRPREYDGSHISFAGMNPEITLRMHQRNAIARILYGGNTLLGHVVGAGKTWEMVAAAQESKRLGLCQKSLFVVPNHLTEQWATEYLQLYPSANILVATNKDFETKNRKRFCGRIATGDYDAIIIGHSQFEKVPISMERQIVTLRQQRREILDGIRELKENDGDHFSRKQMERTKKSIDAKLDDLNDQSRKDNVVTFEELGVDRIFIDEAHYYKNLASFSKMRNVSGIAQTEAQKSSDLYMKCRYLDEITGGRGVIFATGTPISNTMVEMFTMQKYLQYNTLKKHGLLHFDAWASTFGETVTTIELAPEGTGYRSKTRFAKFYNLPELMAMFKEVADIQTADMLNLPVPKANYHNIILKPSELQKEMVAGLAERAEKVRNKEVRSDQDNMLLITNDGRKLALDQRLLNPMLPDSDTGKVSACAENVFEIWQRTTDQRSTQMVFCDLSTPKGNGEFNIYDDLRDKLISKGIPAEEIAYVHSANTEAKKKELFGKVRSGQIRVLIGSTQKMGAGTNVQSKLIALHHLDCPWRPSDLQQREGRIIRQGNENNEVDIYTYVTENTFDSYLYQMVENKQKFIGQIMTSKSPVRSAEDIDETALSYAEIKALCAGDKRIKEKIDLDIDVQRLKLLKASHLSQKYSLEDNIIRYFPQQIAIAKAGIKSAQEHIAVRDANTHPNKDGFSPMVVAGVTYTEKKAAGAAILSACKTLTHTSAISLGTYRGFVMELSFDPIYKQNTITLSGVRNHIVSLGTDIFGNIQRLDNLLNEFERDLNNAQKDLTTYETQLASAKIEVEKPFPQEDELKRKSARLDELNIALNLDKQESEIVDGDVGDEAGEPPARDSGQRDR